MTSRTAASIHQNAPTDPAMIKGCQKDETIDIFDPNVPICTLRSRANHNVHYHSAAVNRAYEMESNKQVGMQEPHVGCVIRQAIAAHPPNGS